MSTPRRRFLGWLATGLLSNLCESGVASEALAREESRGCSSDVVEALLEVLGDTGSVTSRRMTWIASATITVFSVPVFSRRGVGSGYAVIDDARLPSGDGLTSIQFGAGSWPESAHGLNRFGIIHEVTRESGGAPDESAYSAFITSSREKSISEASSALKATDATMPCVTAEGHAARGLFAVRIGNLEFPSRYTWRDAGSTLLRISEATAHASCNTRNERGGAGLFLYTVRRAIVDRQPATERPLIFNGKRFTLRTLRAKDPAIGAHLAERGIVADPNAVLRLDASIKDETSGVVTPFRVWFEAGATSAPPVRFEYQAKSFLRLIFEMDTTAPIPQVRSAIRSKQTA